MARIQQIKTGATSSQVDKRQPGWELSRSET